MRIDLETDIRLADDCGRGSVAFVVRLNIGETLGSDSVTIELGACDLDPKDIQFTSLNFFDAVDKLVELRDAYLLNTGATTVKEAVGIEEDEK